MSGDELNETPVREYQVMPSDSPYAALAEELFRERVLEARRMSPEEKVLASQQLFESACEITLAGIRNQFPGQSEDSYLQILRERLALRRKLQRTS